MKYNPNEIEKNWQKYWAENQTFAAENNSDKPKYYVLDMFPYPSGAGLHVGHPLGYIASDIVARYKRHQGFNVLHPQGYDSFGLPAEQYAIQTGQHPEKTTKENIARYREQLDKIGFSFDWSREVRTSSPEYYKWTQWIFIQLFNSWYDKDANQARDIKTLIMNFEEHGNAKVNAVSDDNIPEFSAEDWKSFSTEEQQEILLKYRLTYLAETEVNWCPALGTVLANDEIVNGVSERGGHPVIRKKMTQWSMRISAYAERLLQGLDTIDWTESLKESQRNWIGKSTGASVTFKVKDSAEERDTVDYILSGDDTNEYTIEVFTTRPDTIFGVTFVTLAPEHDLVSKITTPEQKQAVEAYIEATAKRSERERMADVKTISGVFTGAYAEHPFTKEAIPVWIGDYVLSGYGTGAVMAVPCGDERDYAFAKHFNIEIKNIFDDVDISKEAFTSKDNVKIANSDFLNGLNYKEATKKAIEALEEIGQGKGKTNYRLRDAVFSRQRYWGEPFPVYYVNGLPQMIDPQHLPIRLPEVEKYLPTEDGQPPLGNATEWAWDSSENRVVSNELIDDKTIFPLELNTMPGWAGSSWYWLRYMDAHNENDFVSDEAQNYWQNVDLYIGGSEHATGHLLYSRFWNKFLKDRGFVNQEEPFKKLINQGMILGMSAKLFKARAYIGTSKKRTYDRELLYALFDNEGIFYISTNYFQDNFEKIEENTYTYKSFDIKTRINDIRTYFENQPVQSSQIMNSIDDNDFNLYLEVYRPYVDISQLKNGSETELDIKKYVNYCETISTSNILHEIWIDDNGNLYNCQDPELFNAKFIVSREVDKMSKSKLNVINPNLICEEYGADTLRLYEMFLGPLEQAKPWNTAGITGVFGFLKKLWKLYFDDNGLIVNSNPAKPESLKTLHKTIKKVQEDIENFSFNTSVSSFMIAVNELTAQNCHERSVLEPLAILISPYAPHIAEELWKQLGHTESISTVPFPRFNPEFLVESNKDYPVSFNGKMRFTINLPLDLTVQEIEKIVMEDERTQKQLNGVAPKKVIIVPGKIINLVG
ncbi:leucine--tRNA ligase [Flavobacterium sp. NST-5]|uniref:Leucine--tRNA ligase n=1 Tax=Flavobacterium ichthyis TaxID=2698827 RepID=A0ABW9ZBY6_9FLAO|nr:class I tRNA ligase family protein [Flavobacterium ichthyis]NBL64620.1 leucine--tRNA ligase [Flavobacterium ichthyis]